MNENVSQISIEPLISFFKTFIPLNKAEKQLVGELFKPRVFRRRQYVLQAGDVCTHFNFVVKGCLRMYRIDDKGNIHILQFAAENSCITDLGSFYSGKTSELDIDALEDTTVLQISYDNLIILYKLLKFNRIFRVLIENCFIALQQRLLQNISSTAEERYLSFMEIYPHLSNRLPQTQIAAFLGITPEFLSRLRNKRSKSKPLNYVNTIS